MERIEISRIETNISSSAGPVCHYTKQFSLSEKCGCNVYVTPFVLTTHLNCAWSINIPYVSLKYPWNTQQSNAHTCTPIAFYFISWTRSTWYSYFTCVDQNFKPRAVSFTFRFFHQKLLKVAQLHLKPPSNWLLPLCKWCESKSIFLCLKGQGRWTCLVSKFAAKPELSNLAFCCGIATKQFIWPAAKPVNILLPVKLHGKSNKKCGDLRFHSSLWKGFAMSDVFNKSNVEKLKCLGSISKWECLKNKLNVNECVLKN